MTMKEAESKIPYERLMEIAHKMHLWIFHHTCDEYKAYKECGITDEEDAILGYGGQIVIESNETAEEELI